MSNVKQLFVEALNPLNKIASGILKKLNYIESSIIIHSKTFEEAQDFLNKTAQYHSNAYEDLSPENQDIVLHKIYDRIHNTLKTFDNTKPVEEANNLEVLEQKIYTFLKTNGGILYPLENAAKNLAKALTEDE